MLNIAIVEDECVYANHLRDMIGSWASGKAMPSVSIFFSSADFFQRAQDISCYDVIFIDITLDMDGIAFAGRLLERGYKNTLIIISNNGERAIDGYKVNAYRYYIKPLQPADVKECMDYALNKKSNDYFQYSRHGHTHRIAYDSILYFESMKHYLHIHVSNDLICIKGTLKAVQKQCPSYFFRCQRSYIVNSHYILERTGNLLKLKGEKYVSISPLYFQSLAKVFE